MRRCISAKELAMQQLCHYSSTSPPRQFRVSIYNRLGDEPPMFSEEPDAELEHVLRVPRPDVVRQLLYSGLQIYATVCGSVMIKPYDHAPTKPRSLDLQVCFGRDEFRLAGPRCNARVHASL